MRDMLINVGGALLILVVAELVLGMAFGRLARLNEKQRRS